MSSCIDMYESARKRRNPGICRVHRLPGLTIVAVAATLGCAGDSPTAVTPPDGPVVAVISVDPGSGALFAGDTIRLRATARDADGKPLEGRTFVWATSDSTVAVVSAGGLVTTRATGEVTISAWSDGRRGTASLTVSDVAASRVVVAPEAATVAWNGDTVLRATVLDAEGRPLAGRLVTWSSSDRTIADVDPTGRVVAKGPGVATIWAVAEQRSGVAEVRVLPAPVSRVVLPAGPLALETSESQALAVRLLDPLGREVTGRAVTWTSSNAGAAFVSAEGRVYALQPGNATITATSEGVSESVEVGVLARPALDLVYHRYSPPSTAELFVLGLGAAATPARINAGTVSRDPSASPDGTRIAFAVSQPDPVKGGWMNDLYIVGRDGMNVVWLTRDDGWEIEPAWSPDGTRIAYTKLDVSTGERDVWVVRADGTGAVNLTAGLAQGSSGWAPAWSPDGSRIAFSMAYNGTNPRIWIMNADGTGAAPLATDVGADSYPTWSPDGKYIAFERADGLSSDVAIAPVTGGAATRIAIVGEQRTPAWSPAGDYIAFAQYGSDGRMQLYTMRPDGSAIRLRTSDPAWGGGDRPAWIRRR